MPSPTKKRNERFKSGDSIAVIATASGQATNDIVAKAYRCTSGNLVLSTVLDAPFSPLNGVKMESVDVAGVKEITIKHDELAHMVLLATVESTVDESKQSISYYAPAEFASIVEEFHSPVTGELIAVSEDEQARIAADVETKLGVATAADDDAAEEDEVIIDDEEVEKDPEEELDEDGNPIAPEDEELDEEEGKKAKKGKATASVTEPVKRIVPNKVAPEIAEAVVGVDDVELCKCGSEVAAKSCKCSEVATVPEVIEPIAEEIKPEAEAVATTVVTVKPYGDVEFSSDSLIVAAVVPNDVYGVYAISTASNEYTQLGMLRKSSAKESASTLYSKPEALRTALIAAVENEGQLTDLGFNEVIVSVDVARVVLDAAKVSSEALATAVESARVEAVEDFKNSLEVAFTGINKGLYPNSVATALTAALARRNISAPAKIAALVLATAGNDYATEVVERAASIYSETPERRAGIALTVRDAVAARADETDETASLISTAFIGETASTVANKQLAHSIESAKPVEVASVRSLFSRVGRR
jgi:hypothetical protein